jgi:hypothetical protein
MTVRQATYFPAGVNVRFPGNAMDGQIALRGRNNYNFDLGAPAAASNTVVANAAAITNAASTITTSLPLRIGGNGTAPHFGRALRVVGGTAGDNAVVTVSGEDYLGQVMSEAFTLNGTTGVVGKKAFCVIRSIGVAAGNANASSSISVGTLDVLGLPKAATSLLHSTESGIVAGSAHTFVAAVTSTATTTTGDVRGTVDPNSACDGTKTFGGTLRLIDADELDGVAQA